MSGVWISSQAADGNVEIGVCVDVDERCDEFVCSCNEDPVPRKCSSTEAVIAVSIGGPESGCRSTSAVAK